MQLQASFARELSFTDRTLLFLSLVLYGDVRFDPLFSEAFSAVGAGSLENRDFSTFPLDNLGIGSRAFVTGEIARFQEPTTTLGAL